MSLVAITSSSPSIMSSSSPPSDPRTRPMASTYQRPSQLAYQVNNCYGNNYGQQVPSFLITNAADNTSSVPRKDSRNETILSGQFMVSEISEETDSGVQVGTDEADHEYNSDYGESGTGTINSAIVSPVNSEVKSMDLTTECMETTTKYQGKSGFQSVTIDKSLSKLFHCMSLAYSGKLTSPKWKSFKGLRLKLKDKIRLNNIIWRAWHMQCKYWATATVTISDMDNIYNLFVLFGSVRNDSCLCIESCHVQSKVLITRAIKVGHSRIN